MPLVIQWVDKRSGTEQVHKINTPAGRLLIVTQSGVIVKTDWDSPENSLHTDECPVFQALDRYWLSPEKPVHISLLTQGTPFRNRVWAELCNIPHGETVTYANLAGRIGSAARAVGNACRDNPFPMLIPCHRVVAKSGMGGYSGHTAGDFMAIKRQLLEFEAQHNR